LRHAIQLQRMRAKTKRATLVPVSYRLPKEISDFIRAASKRERISQSRFLQECVTRHGKSVAADPFNAAARKVVVA